MFRRSVSLAAVSALFASQAWACAFHGYNPQITFVERLLGSEHIVLARPSEARPFRYSDIEVLEGTADYVDIPHLVDSIARRRLAANPDDHILFARDGAYGPWQRIAYVNPAMQDVLDVVMAELPEWEMGADEERFAYFASLLNHPDKEVHALALRELDLADYSILRQLVLDVDPQRLISRLGLQSETDLRPIRVLLLGLSGARIDQAFFENGVAKSSDYSGGCLGRLRWRWSSTVAARRLCDWSTTICWDEICPKTAASNWSRCWPFTVQSVTKRCAKPFRRPWGRPCVRIPAWWLWLHANWGPAGIGRKAS